MKQISAKELVNYANEGQVHLEVFMHQCFTKYGAIEFWNAVQNKALDTIMMYAFSTATLDESVDIIIATAAKIHLAKVMAESAANLESSN